MDEQRTAADGDKAGDAGDDTVGDAAAIITDVTGMYVLYLNGGMT